MFPTRVSCDSYLLFLFRITFRANSLDVKLMKAELIPRLSLTPSLTLTLHPIPFCLAIYVAVYLCINFPVDLLIYPAIHLHMLT